MRFSRRPIADKGGGVDVRGAKILKRRREEKVKRRTNKTLCGVLQEN